MCRHLRWHHCPLVGPGMVPGMQAYGYLRGCPLVTIVGCVRDASSELGSVPSVYPCTSLLLFHCQHLKLVNCLLYC